MKPIAPEKAKSELAEAKMQATANKRNSRKERDSA